MQSRESLILHEDKHNEWTLIKSIWSGMLEYVSKNFSAADFIPDLLKEVKSIARFFKRRMPF